MEDELICYPAEKTTGRQSDQSSGADPMRSALLNLPWVGGLEGSSRVPHPGLELFETLYQIVGPVRS